MVVPIPPHGTLLYHVPGFGAARPLQLSFKALTKHPVSMCQPFPSGSLRRLPIGDVCLCVCVCERINREPAMEQSVERAELAAVQS